MMVLVIVLGVFTSLVMVSMDTTVSNQAMQETIGKMDSLQKAIAKFKADSATSSRPTNLADLVTTTGAPCTAVTATSKMQGWCGPYLEVIVSNNSTDYATDGWGTTFSWTSGTGVLTSLGPNKAVGGGDDITRTLP